MQPHLDPFLGASPLRKLVYQVDDSSTARTTIGNVLKRVIPEIDLRQYPSARAMMKDMVPGAPVPWMIVSDFKMPELTGKDLLEWVKRNPGFHSAPVVLVSAEMEECDRAACLKKGAFSYLGKPLEDVQIQEVIQKYIKQELPVSDLIELDKGFAEELEESTGEMKALAQSLTAEKVKELYRRFHTVKGSANSLQFPHFGEFMHVAEGYLNAIQKSESYGAEEVRRTLTQIVGYVESQAAQIRAGILMELPPVALTDQISSFLARVNDGWKSDGSPAAKAGSAPGGDSDAEAGADESVSKSSNSVRITNERLNELQLKFKKIIQLRVQFNTFANQLKQEFFDEAFPNDLLKLVEQLNLSASEVMEFFISLRVTSVARLGRFCSQVVQATARQLDKQVKLDFSAEQTLEVDQAVMECLDNAFTHILKNSIDHGIEAPAKRLERSKEEVGKIKVDLRSDGKESFIVTIQDDGGGINAEALKAAVHKKGLIKKETLDQLSDDNVCELIFVDGLSTKQEVSEVSGRGVGLSAVKESIINLGGVIQVTSVLGEGSKFTIKLPRYFKL